MHRSSSHRRLKPGRGFSCVIAQRRRSRKESFPPGGSGGGQKSAICASGCSWLFRFKWLLGFKPFGPPAQAKSRGSGCWAGRIHERGVDRGLGRAGPPKTARNHCNHCCLCLLANQGGAAASPKSLRRFSFQFRPERQSHFGFVSEGRTRPTTHMPKLPALRPRFSAYPPLHPLYTPCNPPLLQ